MNDPIVPAVATISNSTFLRTIYGELPLGQHGWVCNFRPDPSTSPPSVWAGRAYKGMPTQVSMIDRAVLDNTYFSVAVLQLSDAGEIARSKSALVRLAALVADDVVLQGFVGRPTWVLETSPGKHQVGVKISATDPDAADRELVDRVMKQLGKHAGIDPSGNNCVRYARLAVGTNTKPAAGGFKHRLVDWNPAQELTLDEAAAMFGIDLDQLRTAPKPAPGNYKPDPLLRSLDGVGEGSRNDTVFRYAASFRTGRPPTEDEVEALVLLKASNCVPPLPEDEALKCMKSAYSYPPGKSEAFRKAHIDAETGEIDEGPPVEGPPVEGPPLQPISLQWSELPVNPPEVPFVIPGWMPANVVTLLAAHGGTGKSFISLLIGLSLATGRHPFTGENISSARVVVYSCEDGKLVMQLRLRRLMAMLHIDEAELQGQLDILDATEADNVLFVQQGRDGPKTTPRFDWLRKHCEAFKAEVLIFDNASDAYAADENNRALVRQFLSTLRRIAPTVLLLSHVDAASSMADPRDAKGYSGSTAWNNSARSRWFMAREKNDDILLRVPKVNYAPAGVEATLRWDNQHQVFAVAGVRHGQPKAQDCAPIILTLLREQLAAGAEVSPAINAANSVHNLLKHDPRYPGSVRPTDVAAMVRQWISAGQIALEKFPRRNRTTGQRLALVVQQ